MFRWLTKKYRWDRDVVNELVSCRQFLDGAVHKDNDRFVVEVLNRAVRYTLRNHPFFKSISEVDGADRAFGKVIEVRVSRENWHSIRDKLDQMAAMDESDLLQFCVKHYLPYLKSMRALPDDPEFHFEEETQISLLDGRQKDGVPNE
jgi:hypothetical protein